MAQTFSLSQAKMKLIAKILAETGMRDMFALLHATIRKHGQRTETVHLRNQWSRSPPQLEDAQRHDYHGHAGSRRAGGATTSYCLRVRPA